ITVLPANRKLVAVDRPSDGAHAPPPRYGEQMFGPSVTSERVAVPAEAAEGKLVPRAAFAVARGHCRPFGASVLPGGVNFAVFSRHAQAVHLVLFREGHEEPIAE